MEAEKDAQLSITLLGYMGSGKSTVAQAVASSLSIPAIDLDSFLEKKEGKTICEITTEKGMIYFRKKEYEVLNELLQFKSIILSVGGGTPCYYNAMDKINQYSKSVFLQCSTETLFNRLRIEKKNRPLISHIKNSELKEFIAKHLFQRNTLYQRAQYHIICDHKSPEQIAREIVALFYNLRSN